MYEPFRRSVLLVIIGCVFTVGVLAACMATNATQDPPTPTPEVFIPRTAVVPKGPVISGRVLWGLVPVPGARVELRTGAWADSQASETIAQTNADANGHYTLEAPPAGGEFGLVARWPDGGANMAPVTPVQVTAGQKQVEADVYLAQELTIEEPAPGAEVGPAPVLRWTALPEAVQYRLWVIDAGTTELVVDQTTTETVWHIEAPLQDGRTYQWTVSALDGDGSLVGGLDGEFTVVVEATGPSTGTPDKCRLADHNTYVDQINGFCFAYPANFQARVNEAGNPVFYGPALDNSVEPIRANLLVEVLDAADKTLAQVVDEYLTQFSGMNVPPIARTASELGGEPAEMLEVVPGLEGSRDLWMVRDGSAFHLMFMPSIRDFPQANRDVELLYNTVVHSFALMTNTAP